MWHEVLDDSNSILALFVDYSKSFVVYRQRKCIYLIVEAYIPHLVGAQLCRLSPVDAPTVALKPVMGK